MSLTRVDTVSVRRMNSQERRVTHHKQESPAIADNFARCFREQVSECRRSLQFEAPTSRRSHPLIERGTSWQILEFLYQLVFEGFKCPNYGVIVTQFRDRN